MRPVMLKQIIGLLSIVAQLTAAVALVAACGGGGGGPTPITVTAVTVTGLPSAPLAPMQSAQLGAQAAYSDGSVKDVTATATWSTTDASILTVSGAGLVTATGPGQAEVMASFGGVSGRAGMQVVALPAAYFIDGVEYAFDYQLDAQGRVDNYRISQRPGITYSSAPDADLNVTICTGSLSHDYLCKRAGFHTRRDMSGVASRLASTLKSEIDGYGCQSGSGTTYTYATQRLDSVSFSGWVQLYVTGLPGRCMAGGSSKGTWTLNYDEAERLVGIARTGEYCAAGTTTCTPEVPSSVVVTTDAQGRLQRAGATQWSYDASGFMEQVISTLTDAQGVVSQTSTRYGFDGVGWLTSRVVRSESRGQSPTETADTYGITRWGANVAEEQFTQAEPKDFYASRAPQRVRYEWGRLPTEPTFVPRALTGLNGADYFGIISSHHR